MENNRKSGIGSLILNLLIRGVFGVIAIVIVNAIMQQIGAEMLVGINGWTIGIVSVFGIPGVALLYGALYLMI